MSFLWSSNSWAFFLVALVFAAFDFAVDWDALDAAFRGRVDVAEDAADFLRVEVV